MSLSATHTRTHQHTHNAQEKSRTIFGSYNAATSLGQVFLPAFCDWSVTYCTGKMYPNWPTKSSTVFYTFKEWSTFFFFKRVFKFLNIYKLKEILFKDCNNLILIFQKQLENLLLIVSTPKRFKMSKLVLLY